MGKRAHDDFRADTGRVSMVMAMMGRDMTSTSADWRGTVLEPVEAAAQRVGAPEAPSLGDDGDRARPHADAEWHAGLDLVNEADTVDSEP